MLLDIHIKRIPAAPAKTKTVEFYSPIANLGASYSVEDVMKLGLKDPLDANIAKIATILALHSMPERLATDRVQEAFYNLTQN